VNLLYEAAAKQAWQNTLDWFNKYLRSAPGCVIASKRHGNCEGGFGRFGDRSLPASEEVLAAIQ
jgi:hypothetical protein